MMFSVGKIKGSGCEHMKFLTFGTSLHKMKHPNFYGKSFSKNSKMGRNIQKEITIAS